jgi:hypothetical protein
MKTVTVDIASDAATGLNETQSQALRRLLQPMIEIGLESEDPLESVLTASATQAREAGLTDDDIEAELAAYNSERRL